MDLLLYIATKLLPKPRGLHCVERPAVEFLRAQFSHCFIMRENLRTEQKKCFLCTTLKGRGRTLLEVQTASQDKLRKAVLSALQMALPQLTQKTHEFSIVSGVRRPPTNHGVCRGLSDPRKKWECLPIDTAWLSPRSDFVKHWGRNLSSRMWSCARSEAPVETGSS